MASILGKTRRFAWTALVLFLLVSANGAGLTSPHADMECPAGFEESCEAVGPTDEEHCHCLQTLPPVNHGWQDHVAAEVPHFATGSRFRLVAEATPPDCTAREGGPPRGSPFASGTGLTLHD